jgi:hypothetical protein
LLIKFKSYLFFLTLDNICSIIDYRLAILIRNWEDRHTAKVVAGAEIAGFFWAQPSLRETSTLDGRSAASAMVAFASGRSQYSPEFHSILPSVSTLMASSAVPIGPMENPPGRVP